MPPSKTQEPQRIAKLLARAGIASRREIERMIADGRIALDGKLIDTPATVLTSLAGITVDGAVVEAAAPARLFRYHKPAGLLTAERDFTGRPTIYDNLPEGLPRVIPVGRLDLGTEGLLLLTTDGELKRELELPSTGVERSYRARAFGHVTQEALEDLMLGVEIEGVRYGSINANIERRTGANLWIEMTLTEGKNREVRRVLEFLGLQVNRLIRTRYGPFWLGDLPPGDVDEIRQHDLVTFRTVLSKPGGGKAASNLQFAVRQRVAEAPKPKGVEEPQGRRRIAAPVRAPRPPQPVDFAPRPAPEPKRDERPAPGGRSDRQRPPRGEAPARPERPVRSGAPVRADAPVRPERPARSATFTPRATPAARSEDARKPAPARPAFAKPAAANPARAARAANFRDHREPQAGEVGDRPTKPRTRGPSDGRGKPAKKPRPTRTRK